MNKHVNAVPRGCHFCGNMTKPRVTPRKEKGQIIQEVKWICDRCGVPFEQGILKTPTV